MGLIEIASNNSFWRGVDYYNQEKVISWKKNENGGYEGIVRGSHKEKYEVSIDLIHPRKSKCTCPFASDSRVICKHMLALYFTAEPDELKSYLKKIEDYERELEEEEEERYFAHEQELMNRAKSMTKSELIEELVLAWLRLEDCESDRYY